MTTRNRTAEFLAIREGFEARRRPRQKFNRLRTLSFESNEEFSPLKNKSVSFDTRLTVTPIWYEKFEETKSIIKKIKENMIKIGQLHKNRLLVRFDSKIEESQDEEIDFYTQAITDGFRKAEQSLKHFDTEGSGQEKTAEELIKQNIKRQVAFDLQKCSMEFRQSQKEYLKQLSAQKVGGNELDDLLGLNNDNFFAEETQNDVFGNGMFLDQEQEQIQESIRMQEVRERDEEISKLAENITELATIFKDLATLVIDQGTILDRIDYNLENVQIKTEQGLNELVQADKYAKNSRPFKCIMILVATIIVESFFLIVKHS
eukprot:snap_masked-scaffold_35-processed-gene-0.4-mRNA-1 protein AED:0.00 eAED:0.00 QI:234/1/1/1/1/1/2/269/316